MKRICKNCKSFDCEKSICTEDGSETDSESRPHNYDGFCFEPKDRKTPAEISIMRSIIGTTGGKAPHVSRGRKPGNRIARIQIQAHKIDRDVLFAYAQKKGMTIVRVLHFLASVILQNNKDIKPPDGWIPWQEEDSGK